MSITCMALGQSPKLIALCYELASSLALKDFTKVNHVASYRIDCFEKWPVENWF